MTQILISRTLLVCGALLLAPAARAQVAPGETPRQQPTNAPPAASGIRGLLEDDVDVLLRQWCDKTSQVKVLYAEFERESRDTAFKDTVKHQGSARFLAPNRARMDIRNDQHLILTGEGILWQVIPEKREAIRRVLPPEQRGEEVLRDGPMPFLLGDKPDRMKRRYKFQILDQNAQSIKISIRPNFEDDKVDFTHAELTLERQGLLPTKLRFTEPNGNMITFQFSVIVTNLTHPDLGKEIGPDHFQFDPRKWGLRVIEAPLPPKKANVAAESTRPRRE